MSEESREERAEREGTRRASGAGGGWTELERAAIVETALQQAIRRGDFDDLPGAGKPIPGLGGTYDPDWWVKEKIERENLSGIGPPALLLRVENAELDASLDEFAREADVREALEDFNTRVTDARRQLKGGPPVVTPTRDVEAEVAAWRERRSQRDADRRPQEAVESNPPTRRRWWQRRG